MALTVINDVVTILTNPDGWHYIEPVIERQPPCIYEVLVEAALDGDPTFDPAGDILALDVPPEQLRTLSAEVCAEVWFKHGNKAGIDIAGPENCRTVLLGTDGRVLATATAAESTRALHRALSNTAREITALTERRDALVRRGKALGMDDYLLSLIAALKEDELAFVLAAPRTDTERRTAVLEALERAGIPTTVTAALPNSGWMSLSSTTLTKGASPDAHHFWVEVEWDQARKELRLSPGYHHHHDKAAGYSREAAVLARRASGVLAEAGFTLVPRISTVESHEGAARLPHYAVTESLPEVTVGVG